MPGSSRRPSTSITWFEAIEWRPTVGAGVSPCVHAKTFGVTVTACGLGASALVKRWDVPFAPNQQDACQSCVAAIAWRQ